MQSEAPRTLSQVDLFTPGAQERWYAAFVADFARPLPQRVMASVPGFPMDASDAMKTAQERFPLSIPAWWSARA